MATEFSGKAPFWEMRGFAGRERRPHAGALGAANPRLASYRSRRSRRAASPACADSPADLVIQVHYTYIYIYMFIM